MRVIKKNDGKNYFVMRHSDENRCVIQLTEKLFFRIRKVEYDDENYRFVASSCIRFY